LTGGAGKAGEGKTRQASIVNSMAEPDGPY